MYILEMKKKGVERTKDGNKERWENQETGRETEEERERYGTR